MLCFSPTWRANPTAGAGRLPLDVNRDGVLFLRQIVAEYTGFWLGGLMAAAATPTGQSRRWARTRQLVFTGRRRRPWRMRGAISCSPPPCGRLGGAESPPPWPDGRAIYAELPQSTRGENCWTGRLQRLSPRSTRAVSPPPSGYLANCVHLDHARALGNIRDAASPRTYSRLQANTSAKSPEEIGGSEHLETEDPERFAECMVNLHRRFGLRILVAAAAPNARHITRCGTAGCFMKRWAPIFVVLFALLAACHTASVRTAGPAAPPRGNRHIAGQPEKYPCWSRDTEQRHKQNVARGQCDLARAGILRRAHLRGLAAGPPAIRCPAPACN